MPSNIIKIFERVIRSQLVQYLETNKLISSNQHGFRKGYSCLSELLIHYDEILCNMNHDNADTDLIYLDFAKAFDKVDHDLLLKKLSRYGIKDQLHTWLTSFLKGRSQTVVVEGFRSYPYPVLSGVPQGTVLGPILFLLFVNDIELSLSHSKVRLFADDSRLSKPLKNPGDVSLLQQDLNHVLDWAKSNNMLLNEDKFELLQHHTSSRNFAYQLALPFVIDENSYIANNTSIQPSDHVTDLGVIMQQDLSFSLHISDMVKRARNKLSWVLSVFKSRSELVVGTLYKSMVRPLLEYCCVVWNPTKLSEIAFIEGIQRTATFKVSEISDLNYWDRLKRMKLMSLQRRRERYMIIYMYKIWQHRVPNDIGIVFYNNQRLGMKARIPPVPPYRYQLSRYDGSFSVMGPSLWNLLPKHINCISNFNTFKQKLDEFLLSYPDQPPVAGYTTINNNSLRSWVIQR